MNGSQNNFTALPIIITTDIVYILSPLDNGTFYSLTHCLRFLISVIDDMFTSLLITIMLFISLEQLSIRLST